jgi:hypothetical protein
MAILTGFPQSNCEPDHMWKNIRVQQLKDFSCLRSSPMYTLPSAQPEKTTLENVVYRNDDARGRYLNQ